MTERESMTRPGTAKAAGRAAPEHAGASPRGWARIVLRLAGSGLLIATAAIHLDLYLTGYRTIPTIGWLFLLQVRAGFALATLAGYLLSVWVGLFGFTEVRTTAGVVAGVVEVAAFAVLAALALAPA